MILPDGSQRDFSMMTIYWDAFDFVLNRFATQDSLIKEAQRLAEVHRLSLDTALSYKTAQLYRWGVEELRVPAPFAPPVCPLAHRPRVRRSGRLSGG